MNFISMFSGIEAASVAFAPMGWKCLALAEIEKFPSSVLAHHYPDVPNVGDMTKHDWSQYAGKVDLVVGGPPCQAFSVAGLRNSLGDDRGQLSLAYMRAIHAIKPRNAIVENVPGWLSTKDNAFGCFLGAIVGSDSPLVPPGGKRWPNSGLVSGPKGRAAWTIKDAQYFGLAQRRRRVFVVSDFGNGADPAAVLFELEGVRGNPAPSREKREDVTPTISARTKGGGGLGTDFDLDGGLIEAAVLRGISDYGAGKPALRAKGGDAGGGSEALVTRWPAEVASTLNAHYGDKWGLEDQHALGGAALFVPAQTHAIQAGALRENPNSGPDGVGVQADIAYTLEARAEVQAVSVTGEISHTLKAEGFDASEDGTGRGNPIIAFSSKDYGADAGALSPTLRAGGHSESHANAGVPPAIAFQSKASHHQSMNPDTISPSLQVGKSDGVAAFYGSAVRRLTPVECERLQGFPEIRKAVMIRVCAEEKPDDAKYVRQSSPAPSRATNEPALVHVQINLERSAVAVHKAGKLIWSASNAGGSNSSHLHTQVESFVRAAVLMTTTADLIALNGKAASQPLISNFSVLSNGSVCANVSGHEIAVLASDAAKFTSIERLFMKSTTLQSGPSSQTFEQTFQTLCCYVVAAISSFTPAGTLPESSYNALVETVVGYTKISDKTADGPRYKALGNSMAVPVMRWIGERIERFMPRDEAVVAPARRLHFRADGRMELV